MGSKFCSMFLPFLWCFSGGGSGGYFFLKCSSFSVSLFLLFCLLIARLLCFCLGLCVELLGLLRFYLHAQCLFVGFNDFLGIVRGGLVF